MNKERISWLVLGIFIVIYFIQASKIADAEFDLLGPRFFPMSLIGVLTLLVIIEIINTLRLKKAGPEAKRTESSAMKGLKKIEINKTMYSVLLIIGYVISLSFAGFFISTLVYLIIQMWILSPKNKRAIYTVAGVSIIGTVLIFLMFSEFLKIPLP